MADNTDKFRQLWDRARRQTPRVAMVLGSGLGKLAERVCCLEQLFFADLPGLEQPTVPGHQGQVVLGTWARQTVLLFSGRLHFYEGHTWQQVVQPVRIAHDLGARVLLLTNAAGGIRDDLVPGSLLGLNAHLEWSRMFGSPNNHEKMGARKQDSLGLRARADFSSPYDPYLSSLLRDAAHDLGTTLPMGQYAQVSGPCFETPAEIRALQALGVDAVGMSTAREAETGSELGLACSALSCITNRAAGLGSGPIHHDEVLSLTARSLERIGALLECFLHRL